MMPGWTAVSAPYCVKIGMPFARRVRHGGAMVGRLAGRYRGRVPCARTRGATSRSLHGRAPCALLRRAPPREPAGPEDNRRMSGAGRAGARRGARSGSCPAGGARGLAGFLRRPPGSPRRLVIARGGAMRLTRRSRNIFGGAQRLRTRFAVSSCTRQKTMVREPCYRFVPVLVFRICSKPTLWLQIQQISFRIERFSFRIGRPLLN